MRLSPLVLLIAAVTLVGSNSLALSPVALEIGRGFGGASAREVLVAAALFGAGTAVAAVGISPYADRIGLSRALFAALCVLTLGMAGTAVARPRPDGFYVGAASGWPCGGRGWRCACATHGLAADSRPRARKHLFGRVLVGWTPRWYSGEHRWPRDRRMGGWAGGACVLSGLGLSSGAMAVRPDGARGRRGVQARGRRCGCRGSGRRWVWRGAYCGVLRALAPISAPSCRCSWPWPAAMAVRRSHFVYEIGIGLASWGTRGSTPRRGAGRGALGSWGAGVQYLALGARRRGLGRWWAALLFLGRDQPIWG